MDDELLSIVREQHRDMRSMAKELSDLALLVARLEASSRAIEAALEQRVKKIEDAGPSSASMRLLAVLAAGVLGVLVVAMYLVAGGDPTGVKELIP